jgi:nitrogen regulatory protein PII
MITFPMKLITVVCEAYAMDNLTRLLRECGARGWTFFPVQGTGARGDRTGEMPDFTNMQLQVIVRPEVADLILTRLEAELFPPFGMIAYESDVRVLRPDKF